MKRIAFLASPNYETTLKKCPGFINEYDLFHEAFAKMGATLESVHWRDTTVDWQQFDRVIPKACWDYSEHPAEFQVFLNQMQKQSIQFRNELSIVRWNLRKNYLLDLQRKGLNVGELTLIPEGSKLDFNEITKQFGDDMIVAKPSISGGARNTIRCRGNTLSEHQEMLNRVIQTSDLILQPFFPEIAEDGEYSIFFFGGIFSHAIVKKPAKGDYRAHQLFGAQNIKTEISRTDIKMAYEFMAAVEPKCAYARVDVFRRSRKLYLVELELIEPYLYLEHAPNESVTRFCEAILS